MRGGAVAARRAHNPKVLGSNPSPATKRQLHIVGLLKNGKPGDLRLWLSNAHHPGDTVSCTEALTLVLAAEAHTGLCPARFP